jgi:hypothetical protein
MTVADIQERIVQELIGTQDKRAFLVEGDDDKEAFRILLERFVPGWEQRWVIEKAGNKKLLQGVLECEAEWVGLVDRDEWDEAEVARRMGERQNLIVLPRFCLESYLINPNELWQALPQARQVDLDGGQREFSDKLLADLSRYVRHGALWRVVTPLWSGLRARGFKEALASRKSVATAQDDEEIKRILGHWDDLLEPTTIYEDFQRELQAAQATSVDDRLRTWVHGKVFWEDVVNPTMDGLFGQMSEKERRRKILRRLPQPGDLQTIFDRLR